MPDETKPEAKVERTFDQKLLEDGSASYLLTNSIEDLKNPDKKQATLGLKDALGKKQIVINLPADELVRALSCLPGGQGH